MPNEYKAPFDGGKTPDPNREGKIKNRAGKLARKAMKAAAAKKATTVEEDVKPTSAQKLNPGLQQRIYAASRAQQPRPMSGMRPIDKIKLMTRKKEVELDEEFINGREYAAHGLMHPKHAMQAIHQPSDRFVDFYASGTGDKMQGKVKSNNGEEVIIQAHPKMGDGKLHTFKVTTDLPKMTNEAKDEGEYDYEGDMAMSQLKSVITNAQKLHDMLEPDTNLPEWVQSKITLAEDYIVTAANYMDGEMNEDAQRDYAYTSAIAADRTRSAASKFADRGFKNPVLSPAQRERRQALSQAATSTSDMESAKFLNPKRPPGSHPDKVIRGLSKDVEQARQGIRALTAQVRAEKKPNLPEEVEQVEEGLVGSLVRAYISPKAQSLVGRGVRKVTAKLGASAQTQRRLQKVGMKWAKRKIGEEVEQIEERAKGYGKLPSVIKSRAAKGKLAVEATDPVGKEDADINNDGKTDKTDVYLHTKRRAIGKAIGARLATKAGK
jgi:lactam utilization protein B